MKLSKIFFIITIIISHIAVAITSSSYIRMKYAIKYEGASAPQYVSLLVNIPWLFIISGLGLITYILKKKGK